MLLYYNKRRVVGSLKKHNDSEESTTDITIGMPCAPNDLRPLPNLLIDTLGGKTAQEIAAGMILQYSQRAGEWVGANKQALAKRIKDARKSYLDWINGMNSYIQWHQRNRLTFGIYELFYEPPRKPDMPSDPLGGSFADLMMIGIAELTRDGLLEVRDGCIFPTPALVAEVAKGWKK